MAHCPTTTLKEQTMTAKKAAAKDQPKTSPVTEEKKEIAQLRLLCAQLKIENARLKINVLSYEGRDQEQALAGLKMDLQNILGAESGEHVV